MYNYHEEKKNLFTEDGMKTYIEIRDNFYKLLKQSGAVRLQEAIQPAIGSSFTMIACIDYMVEQGEIAEVTSANTFTQHRVFVSKKEIF